MKQPAVDKGAWGGRTATRPKTDEGLIRLERGLAQTGTDWRAKAGEAISVGGSCASAPATVLGAHGVEVTTACSNGLSYYIAGPLNAHSLKSRVSARNCEAVCLN